VIREECAATECWQTGHDACVGARGPGLTAKATFRANKKFNPELTGPKDDMSRYRSRTATVPATVNFNVLQAI
jgi:hypothetical protein